MIAEAAQLLRCPHCRGDLTLEGRALRCPEGHSFDLARQGYANLVPAPGDTAAMVQAREAFLGAGHLDFVSAALAERARPGPVVDAGAGPGRHLAAVLDSGAEGPGLALDSSPPALRRAARAHPRAAAVGCDLWAELPLRSHVAATVLSVFSPRNPSELARLLAPEGRLLVASPGPGHLEPLVAELGLLGVDPDKRERLAAALEPHFALEERTQHERELASRARTCCTPPAWGPAPGTSGPASSRAGLRCCPSRSRCALRWRSRSGGRASARSACGAWSSAAPWSGRRAPRSRRGRRRAAARAA